MAVRRTCLAMGIALPVLMNAAWSIDAVPSVAFGADEGEYENIAAVGRSTVRDRSGLCAGVAVDEHWRGEVVRFSLQR